MSVCNIVLCHFMLVMELYFQFVDLIVVQFSNYIIFLISLSCITNIRYSAERHYFMEYIFIHNMCY